MPIINNYDTTTFIISEVTEEQLKSFVNGSKFAVITIDHELYVWGPTSALSIYLDAYTLQIDFKDKSKYRTYLNIWQHKEGFERHMKQYKPIEGVDVKYPSIEELIFMITGKDLIFSARFLDAGGGGIERVINKKLQELVFNLRIEKEYYLIDELFDVRVFFKKVSDEKVEENAYLKPIDIRDFNVCDQIVSILKNECSGFYNDDLVINYASVSDKLQAQYFLAKFHSNRQWDLDPVCILNYRISAFVLPYNVSKEERKQYKKKMAFNIKDGNRYIIDSIHINSDICFDLSEFEKLISGLVTEMSLA